MERPVQAQEVYDRQIRHTDQRRDGERNISSEARELAAKKSRYCFICTRTVNRHRWVGRIYQGVRVKPG